MSVADRIREFWDQDATTYDLDAGHHPTSALVRAAWRAALQDLLPPESARVLDVGAGTGFISLLLAELGHRVTAVDVSSGMLGRLRAKAEAAHLMVEAIQADATMVPAGPFDVIVSRHLLWTLVDPLEALRRWRAVAPEGGLVLIDRTVSDRGVTQSLRKIGHRALDLVRSRPPAHHASYDAEVLRALPLAQGSGPEVIVRLVTRAGWTGAEIRRLHDVDWAIAQEQPLLDRLVSDGAHFAVQAHARSRARAVDSEDRGQLPAGA